MAILMNKCVRNVFINNFSWGIFFNKKTAGCCPTVFVLCHSGLSSLVCKHLCPIWCSVRVCNVANTYSAEVS